MAGPSIRPDHIVDDLGDQVAVSRELHQERKNNQFIHRVSGSPGKCSQRKWAVEISLLLQSYLYADPTRLDFASAEGARGGEALELLLRVGAPSEHLQGLPCHEGVHGVEPHWFHLFANRHIGGIFPHVLDYCHSPAT